MAYFPNGSSGECFDEQCSRCRFGMQACPIWMVQNEFNYEACNNDTARKILDALVSNDGTCAMYELDPDCFRSDESKQMSLLGPQQPQGGEPKGE